MTTTISGLVLDFQTNRAINNADIFVLSTTTSGLLASGTSNPMGYFTFTVPTLPEDFLYTPYLTNYVGYTKQVPSGINYINLYLRYSTVIPTMVSVNMDNAMLSTAGRVRDIKASPLHYYIITEGGLDVLDVNTLNNVGYIKAINEFNCVTFNKEFFVTSGVLIGTTHSGVLTFNMPTFTAPSRDLRNTVIPKFTEANGKLTNNYVNCMDQNTSNEIIIGTISGIDYFTTSGVRYYTLYSGISGTNACKISEFGDLYYSPTNSGLHVRYATSGNWDGPDYTVTLTGTGLYPFPLLSNYINDIDLKSVSGNNSVFLATKSGLIGYDENRSNLNISASGAFLIRNYP